ncbi:baseplate J/gp47 family protein [Pyramidobacter piscolens]|uniref:baseplate J/gp47 family protein n=1 Tax=Pyramidobacter piscolens TaxID=638849 RepID=UPI002AB0D710|nr:baseplate J/gp47 family protein [Pyramidobacter piscolens]
MALKKFAYTKIDFESIVETVTARMKSKYRAQWNDEFEDGLAMMLIEAFAEVCDQNLFYLDQRANECFLTTAKERQSVISHCKSIGYTVQNARPSQVDLTFSVKNALAADVVIPVGTQVETENKTSFETTREGTLRTGTLSVIVPATQGETLDERAGYSNGEATQKMRLIRSGVLSVKRVVVDGETWNAVDGFADSADTDRVYMTELDGQGIAWIIFGDGEHGMIPPANSLIKASYSVGIGAAGNVAAGSIIKLRTLLVDGNGDRADVSVTNASAASGGAEPETIDHAKLYAPRFFETQDRCVTESDYETAAIAFNDPQSGRVAKARAVVTQQTGDANIVTVYILTYSAKTWQASTPSEALKNSLQVFLQERAMLTTVVDVKNGKTQAVDITASIKVQHGFEWESVKSDMIAALHGFFDVNLRDIGQSVRFSDLNSLLDDIQGVEWVEFTAPAGTVSAPADTLLTLGVVTLTEAAS